MQDIDTIQAIRQLRPNPSKFIRKGRGYVDWKFSDVCEYLGYPAALEYIISMQSWHDYQSRYATCTLATTFEQYKQICNEILND